jgi:hypothetical protein
MKAPHAFATIAGELFALLIRRALVGPYGYGSNPAQLTIFMCAQVRKPCVLARVSTLDAHAAMASCDLAVRTLSTQTTHTHASSHTPHHACVRAQT